MLVELLAVVGGVIAGAVTWIAWMCLGVMLNFIAFPFPDGQYPYEGAWTLVSFVLPAAVALGVWHFSRGGSGASREQYWEE